jgi:acetyl-CoA carboxylase carboxyltransferase component
MSLTLDTGSIFEIANDYARGPITCFARLNGHAVGVFSSDCRYYAGSITADGSQKVRRFIQTCETFNLPIIIFVDEPGFMIGSEAEKVRTIRHGTDLVLTVAECQVLWASIVVRKSFGVAAVAHYRHDSYVLAWPSAQSR